MLFKFETNVQTQLVFWFFRINIDGRKPDL